MNRKSLAAAAVLGVAGVSLAALQVRAGGDKIVFPENFAKGVMKEIGAAEFAPEALDQLDYFLACLKERGIWLAEICKSEGFRFSPRLHVDLWGPRRGV